MPPAKDVQSTGGGGELYYCTVPIPSPSAHVADDLVVLDATGDDTGTPAADILSHPRFRWSASGQVRRITLPGGIRGHRDSFLSGERDPVAAMLASIRPADAASESRPGPVCIAALPFDREASGSVGVPETVIGSARDRGAWITSVAPAPGDAVERALAASRAVAAHTSGPPQRPGHGSGSGSGSGSGGSVPSRFSLKPVPTHDGYRAGCADAIRAICAGEIEKVVLARQVLVETDVPIDCRPVLERLAHLYPSCATFRIGQFIGASPELLVRRTGSDVSSHPLAGTIPHSGDRDTDQAAAARLLGSSKERHEHDVAVQEVALSLQRVCSSLHVPSEPSVIGLRNVSHLGTEITGTLRSSHAHATVLDLVSLLHPTPAVAGTPTELALGWIAKLEDFDRGCYAGPVGWMDSSGDGEFFVGIRSAYVAGTSARLMAGAGIVADSDPDAELAETQLKLQALLAALVRP